MLYRTCPTTPQPLRVNLWGNEIGKLFAKYKEVIKKFAKYEKKC